MQPKQVRLLVGLLAALVGVFAGLNNAGGIFLMLAGPESLEAVSRGPFAFLQQSAEPYEVAMRSGVFRWTTFGVSGVGLVAAIGLVLGGCALIAEQGVSRKLLGAWGWYGVVSGPLNVWLTMRYVLPEVQRLEGIEVGPAMMVLQGLFSLFLLWVLPVSLLLVLRLPMLWRSWGGGAEGPAAGSTLGPGRDDDRAVSVPTVLHHSDTASSYSDRYRGLRDDLWNDPSAT